MAQKLDDLPKNEDEFWKDSEKARAEMKSVSCRGHKFVLKRSDLGITAECQCGMGYYISPGTEIKDGHIYIKGKFVI